MCLIFIGVLFPDSLIVFIILITLFMIWEQCLILSTGKTVLRRMFHFARGLRGFVNSAWRWGFVFPVLRKWVTVSRNVSEQSRKTVNPHVHMNGSWWILINLHRNIRGVVRGDSAGWGSRVKRGRPAESWHQTEGTSSFLIGPETTDLSMMIG